MSLGTQVQRFYQLRTPRIFSLYLNAVIPIANVLNVR